MFKGERSFKRHPPFATYAAPHEPAVVWHTSTIPVSGRIFHAQIATFRSTYGPTEALRASIAIAKQDLTATRDALNKVITQDMAQFEQQLQSQGAPWVKGQVLPQL